MREHLSSKPRLAPYLRLVHPMATRPMEWSEHEERRERRRRFARDVVTVVAWSMITVLTVSAMWQLGEILAGQ